MARVHKWPSKNIPEVTDLTEPAPSWVQRVDSLFGCVAPADSAAAPFARRNAANVPAFDFEN